MQYDPNNPLRKKSKDAVERPGITQPGKITVKPKEPKESAPPSSTGTNPNDPNQWKNMQKGYAKSEKVASRRSAPASGYGNSYRQFNRGDDENRREAILRRLRRKKKK